MIKKYRRTIKDDSLRELSNFRPNIWVNVCDPDEEEIKELVEKCYLDSNLITDALDPFEVPRIETEENTTYVFTRAPLRGDSQVISTSPVLIAIGKEQIITIAKKELDFLGKFLKNQTGFTTTQKVKFFIQLFFELNRNYTKSLTEISKRVRAASASFEKISNREIVQFVDFERTINDFLSALIPTNTMLHNLLSGKHLRLYERDIDLIEDLFLSNKQLIEMCSSTLKNIVNIRDAYSTVMTQDTNRIVKLFTSLTVILTIPTIISSIYGMNIDLPLAHSPHAFWGILVFTAATVYTLTLLFNKKDWL